MKVFIDKKDIAGEFIKLNEEDWHHLTRVLRVRDGDEVIACDGERDYRCQVLGGRCQILGEEECGSENKINITLFQGVPKSDKMESVIQMCSELGVNRLVPFHSRYCAVGLPDEKKLERWRRIAKESAMQCGRDRIMEVCKGEELDRAAEMTNDLDLAFVCWEGERIKRVKDLEWGFEVGSMRASTPTHGCGTSAPAIGFFVGSEGGFSGEEIEMLGLPTVTLGKRIMRTQTAGAVVTGIILSLLNEI